MVPWLKPRTRMALTSGAHDGDPHTCAAMYGLFGLSSSMLHGNLSGYTLNLSRIETQQTHFFVPIVNLFFFFHILFVTLMKSTFFCLLASFVSTANSSSHEFDDRIGYQKYRTQVFRIYPQFIPGPNDRVAIFHGTTQVSHARTRVSC